MLCNKFIFKEQKRMAGRNRNNIIIWYSAFETQSIRLLYIRLFYKK